MEEESFSSEDIETDIASNFNGIPTLFNLKQVLFDENNCFEYLVRKKVLNINQRCSKRNCRANLKLN